MTRVLVLMIVWVLVATPMAVLIGLAIRHADRPLPATESWQALTLVDTAGPGQGPTGRNSEARYLVRGVGTGGAAQRNG